MAGGSIAAVLPQPFCTSRPTFESRRVTNLVILTMSSSGLKTLAKEVVTAGDGKLFPKQGDTLLMHYTVCVRSIFDVWPGDSLLFFFDRALLRARFSRMVKNSILPSTVVSLFHSK